MAEATRGTAIALDPPGPFLNANDRPCERCVFIPTPDGKCICRPLERA